MRRRINYEEFLPGPYGHLCTPRLYMLAATPHVTMCAQHDMLTLPSSPAFNCGLLLLLPTTEK